MGGFLIETHRERETDRQTDRQTDRHIDQTRQTGSLKNALDVGRHGFVRATDRKTGLKNSLAIGRPEFLTHRETDRQRDMTRQTVAR